MGAIREIRQNRMIRCQVMLFVCLFSILSGYWKRDGAARLVLMSTSNARRHFNASGGVEK